MIKLVTECVKCTHQEVCAYKNNARIDMEKLSGATYGDGINDDWKTVSDVRHVTIEFSCDKFHKVEVLCR